MGIRITARKSKEENQAEFDYFTTEILDLEEDDSVIKLFEGFSIISVDEILETCLEVLKSLTLVQEDGETIELLPTTSFASKYLNSMFSIT